MALEAGSLRNVHTRRWSTRQVKDLKGAESDEDRPALVRRGADPAF